MEVMTDQARAAQREYAKQWRAKNRDKVRAKNIRYWQKKADKAAEGNEDEQTENS